MVVKKREKIIILFAILAVLIWVFDRFYYTPQKKKITTLKEESKATDLKLRESVLFTRGVETAEAKVARLEKELQSLSDKMFREEEFRNFLNYLRSESGRLQMKMISMTTQDEKSSPSGGKKSTAAFQYRRVTIQMVLHSRFSALRTYLKGMEELPFQVAVDHLQVERIEEGTSLLKGTLGLSVFVVS